MNFDNFFSNNTKELMFNNGQFINSSVDSNLITNQTNPLPSTTTTTMIPLNTSIDQQREFVNQHQQQPLLAMAENDREIYRKNNARLIQMEKEIRCFDSYGTACDELSVWLKDDRAYNEYNEQALVNCIVAIYEKHKEFGIYSGITILETAVKNCSGLSENGRAIIKRYYNQALPSNNNRRTSEGLVASHNSSSRIGSPLNSPTSIRSMSNGNTPQSPVMTSPMVNQTTVNNLFKSIMMNNSSSNTSPIIASNGVLNDQSNRAPNNQAVPSPNYQQQQIAYSQNQQLLQQAISQNSQQQANIAAAAAATATAKQRVTTQLQAQQQESARLQLQQNLQRMQFHQAQHAQQQQQAQASQQVQQQLNQQIQQQLQLQQRQQAIQQQQQQQQAALARNHNNNQNMSVVPNNNMPMYFYQPAQLQQAQQQVQQIQAQLQQQDRLHQQPQQQARPVQQSHQQIQQVQQQLPQLTPQQYEEVLQKLRSPEFVEVLTQQQQRQFRVTNQQQQTRAPVQQQQQQMTLSTVPATSEDISIAVSNPSNTSMATMRPSITIPHAINTPIANNASLTSSNSYTPISSAVVTPTAITPITNTSAAPITTFIPLTTAPSTITVVSPSASTPPPPATSTTTTTTAPAHPSTSAAQNRLPPTPAAAAVPIQRQLFLPHVPQASISDICLPGQNKRSKTLDPVLDKAEYRFSKQYALTSFRLTHDQEFTRKNFFVSQREHNARIQNENALVHESQDSYPLTYIFTSWYQDTSERKCDWPNALRVELNGKELPLEKRVRQRISSSNHTFIGKDLPFDMTKLLRQGENTLRIQQIGCACSYNFCIQIHQRHSERSLRYLVENSTISINSSHHLIDKLLGVVDEGEEDDELQIIQQSVKVSLKCPITMKRMKMPVRGKKCKHVDCFDFSAYLLMNKNKNPGWLCSRCNCSALPDSLGRDLHMEYLLKTLPKNVSEIEFTENHKNYKITKVDDPDDMDDEDDDEKDELKADEKKEGQIKKEDDGNIPSVSTAVVAAAVIQPPPISNVIDLISDDEEEEGELDRVSNSVNSNGKRPRLN